MEIPYLWKLGQSKAFGDVILASLELGTKYLEPRQLSEGKWDFTLMILMQGVKGVLTWAKGKSLKPSKSTFPSSSNLVSKKVDDLVNEDNDSVVEEESHGEDLNDDDDFDDPGLTNAQ
ncbi:hypothetical protein Tco_0663251 [Tanacetum coccineum]